MDLNLLNETIDKSGIKKSAIKDCINCSYYTLSRKLSGQSDITVREMNSIANVLHLTEKQKNSIFFGNSAYKK